MADGSAKPIEKIEVGEKVLAGDAESAVNSSRTVVATIEGSGEKDLTTLTIDIDGPKGDKTDTLTATDGHPFWVPVLNAWTDAEDLNPGQRLQLTDGTRAQITAVTHHTPAHNLTVATGHTYYVLVGNTPVLVHNCGDLGDGWKARSVDDLPSDTGGCEACARDIMKCLGGGEVMQISPKMGSSLWRYCGKDVLWNVHYAVVKDGRVFDPWAGCKGESMDDHLAQREDAAEVITAKMGSLKGAVFTPS